MAVRGAGVQGVSTRSSAVSPRRASRVESRAERGWEIGVEMGPAKGGRAGVAAATGQGSAVSILGAARGVVIGSEAGQGSPWLLTSPSLADLRSLSLSLPR